MLNALADVSGSNWDVDDDEPDDVDEISLEFGDILSLNN